GPHQPLDLVQDIKHAGDTTLISSWGFTVRAVRVLGNGRFATFTLAGERPQRCPGGGSLGYTAVLSRRGVVYESVYCGVRIVRLGTLGP
ncbi:MAG: hypothetical protein ACE5I7_08860, partial [Candidatus Binatia bacterium]